MSTDPTPPPELYIDQDMLAPDVHRLAGGDAVVFTTHCPGSASTNEDSAAVIPLGTRAAVLVVADGVGGGPGGARASGIAVRCLSNTIKVLNDQTDLREPILTAIDQANQQIQDLGTGAATTIAVAEIFDHHVRTYHAGDSPVFVVGQRGKIKLQTIAHSPIGFALESGLVNESEAMQHEHRHIVSNVVGSNSMRVEIGPTLPLSRHDTLLLASDGLADNLDAAQLINHIRKGPLITAARSLVMDTHKMMTSQNNHPPAGKPDDLTFMLFRRTS